VIGEFLETFAGNILLVDEPVARTAASIRAGAHKRGHTAGLADGLIAATTLVHGLTVATRNVGDFDRLGAATLNPWT
jgi:hypothetical protein